MSTSQIHLQAVISPSARIAPSVQIGAYAVVGDDVELGDGCVLHPHATVQGPSKIGRNNVFYSFSAVGGDPQDLRFQGERTELVVGDGNTFREYVTISRGTVGGGGKTVIGSENLFLAYSHVGHDSRVGNKTSTRTFCDGSRCSISITGIRNASVLPVPVCAVASTSLPSRAHGIACAWMGVGVVYCMRASDAVSAAGRPNVLKSDIIMINPVKGIGIGFRARANSHTLRPTP